MPHHHAGWPEPEPEPEPEPDPEEEYFSRRLRDLLHEDHSALLATMVAAGTLRALLAVELSAASSWQSTGDRQQALSLLRMQVRMLALQIDGGQRHVAEPERTAQRLAAQ